MKDKFQFTDSNSRGKDPVDKDVFACSAQETVCSFFNHLLPSGAN